MKKQISLYLMVLLIFSTFCATATADVLPPALEIEEVSFSEVLYAGQTRTLSINIKNTEHGGNAHDLTVELSSNLQGLSFPASTPVPTIPKGSTQIVEILVSGKKDLSNNDKARIRIRLIDKGHNQEVPFDKPRIHEFETREIELVFDWVKVQNVSRPNNSIRRNDVINLKFHVQNKSGVMAKEIKVTVDNNQKGVKWIGVEIGNELVIVKRGESPPKEHPIFARLNSKEHEVINYLYHLDGDFTDPEVRFTISGIVGSEKDHWAKEEYKHPVIIPFSWLPIVFRVGGAVIVAIIIGGAIKKRWKIVPHWVSNFRFSIRIPSSWFRIFGWVVGGVIVAIIVHWVSNFFFSSVHTGGVWSVAYSPDGGTLASGSWDKTVKLWDVNTHRNIATFEGHTELVISVAYSPDGRTLASGSGDETVKLWDVNTHRNIATFTGVWSAKGHRSAVSSVAYSPDGKILASGSWDKTVKLWDVSAILPVMIRLGANDKTVKPWHNRATFEGHTGGVDSVAYSPDGKTLASGSEDKTVKLWDVNTQRNIATFEGHTGGVDSVAYSPDGKTLASGSEDKTVKLWDVNTQRNIATFEGHTRGVNSVAYSPDGETLASGSWDKTVKLWDVNTQRNIATY